MTKAPSQMNEPYSRRVSFNERLYVVTEQLSPGFCIQIVFEGKGESGGEDRGALSEERIRDAVAHAAESNPGSRLILKGVLGWTRWVADGPPPAVRVVGHWAEGEAAAPEMERPLCPYNGPTCEVVLTKAPQPRMVFRCFHGVMDARGLMHFAEEVFRGLRSEALLGTNSTLNDTEFVESLVGPRKRAALKDDCPTIGTPSETQDRTVRWRRYSLHGPMPGLVAKIAVTLARHANRLHERLIRIMIPVDLRNYDRSLLSTGNLSYPLFLEVTPEQSWQDVQKKILKGLMKKEALQLDPLESIVPWIPLWLLRLAYAWWTAQHRQRLLFPMTSLVTHVALKGTELFKGDEFSFDSYYFMPPQSEYLPLCISAVSIDDTTEMVISAPRDLMDEEQLEELGETLSAQMAEY